MNWSGRKGDSGWAGARGKWKHKTFIWSGNRPAVKLEGCHSAPVHFKTIRNHMHGCKHQAGAEKECDTGGTSLVRIRTQNQQQEGMEPEHL